MHLYVLLSFVATLTLALDNGKALSPPLGFRSWNYFGGNITQQLMIEVMNALVVPIVDGVSLFDLGYSDAGVDDGWQLRDSGPGGIGYHTADGAPIVNLETFPNLTEMTTHGHSLNLTVGWYGNNCISSDPSNNLTHFMGDVQAFRRYNFDSYKIDSCGGEKNIQLWSDLLAASGQAVTIENCKNSPWFPEPPYMPGRPVWCPFNFYRTSSDNEVLYGVIFGVNLPSVVPFAAQNLSFPSCFAYPDMLEVGVTPGLHHGEVALTYEEARAHFGAWCISSSPLILGLDVRNTSLVTEFWPIIGNAEAIAINQEYVGSSGVQFLKAETNVTFKPCGNWRSECSTAAWEVWVKPVLTSVAVLFLNHEVGGVVNVTINFQDIPGLNCTTCKARDVWAHTDLGYFTTSYTATVPSHDSVFLKFSAN